LSLQYVATSVFGSPPLTTKSNDALPLAGWTVAVVIFVVYVGRVIWVLDVARAFVTATVRATPSSNSAAQMEARTPIEAAEPPVDRDTLCPVTLLLYGTSSRSAW